MLLKKILINTLLFWAGIYHLSAQNQSNNSQPYSVGFSSSYGFILLHTPSIGHLAQQHPYGFEVTINQITTGKKAWHQLYRYPEFGYTVGFFDFRNPLLGKAMYTLAYMDKPLVTYRKSSIRIKIGTGLTYITNPFDAEKNFQNTALSSAFMYAMQGDFFWKYHLNTSWQIKSGISLTHFSNGAFKIPNSGVNIPALKIGVTYVPDPIRITKLVTDTVPDIFNKKYQINFSSAFTIKEVGLPGGKKYPGVVLSAYVNRKMNKKSALNIGIDGFYTTAIKYQISKDPDLDTLQLPDFKRVGVTIGHELFIGQLSMLIQLGKYVYNPYSKIDSPVYQRYGLKYAFNKYVFAGIILKTHFGTADFIEWTIGTKW